MAKKRKYFVDIPKAKQFLTDAYGLQTKEVNYYHLKIWHAEFEGTFDWYHTQGTLVVTTPDYCASIASLGDEEEVAIEINKYVDKKQT